MLTMTQVEGGNILEFTLDGGMTREEFDRIAAKIEDMLKVHRQIRLVEVIKRMGAIEPSALWEDLKFGPRHLKDFSHVAVVADQKWIEWMAKIGQAMIPAEVRTFHLEQLEEARNWIRQA